MARWLQQGLLCAARSRALALRRQQGLEVEHDNVPLAMQEHFLHPHVGLTAVIQELEMVYAWPKVAIEKHPVRAVVEVEQEVLIRVLAERVPLFFGVHGAEVAAQECAGGLRDLREDPSPSHRARARAAQRGEEARLDRLAQVPPAAGLVRTQGLLVRRRRRHWRAVLVAHDDGVAQR
eukprot:CAMPEP_0202079728 /NCGR_PEP_ID=MMETSP0964-20121228/6647_1 /ASSEMBLY_ACC=CAM_ASM_000500 /TAXON_ID=4773 /ORGANISM="Schizochytrium aggregatum, Strain ATCC28209" /LENGTH=177 /DNA_ID=CAMNT_0048647079 /DNA_START=1221 /DNA_END=1751 /DNA_ORIENTATION=+